MLPVPGQHPPVTQEVDHLPGVARTGHDEHLFDARQLQQTQRVQDHRPLRDREQVLVRDSGQLPEPGRLTTAQIRPFTLAALARDLRPPAGRSPRHALGVARWRSLRC